MRIRKYLEYRSGKLVFDFDDWAHKITKMTLNERSAEGDLLDEFLYYYIHGINKQPKFNIVRLPSIKVPKHQPFHTNKRHVFTLNFILIFIKSNRISF